MECYQNTTFLGYQNTTFIYLARFDNIILEIGKFWFHAKKYSNRDINPETVILKSEK